MSKLERISEKVSVKSKPSKKCICEKNKHKSEGAAQAQLRALQKIESDPTRQSDLKNPNKLRVYRSRQCERFYGDKKEIWHVGHK